MKTELRNTGSSKVTLEERDDGSVVLEEWNPLNATMIRLSAAEAITLCHALRPKEPPKEVPVLQVQTRRRIRFHD